MKKSASPNYLFFVFNYTFSSRFLDFTILGKQSTLFYWQNAWNRIAILGRYIILIFIWMDIIICCLQKIPRSAWTRKVSCGARLSDTWKGDQTKKMQTEFTLKNTDLNRLQPINTLNPLPLRVTDNISPNIITPESNIVTNNLRKS